MGSTCWDGAAAHALLVLHDDSIRGGGNKRGRLSRRGNCSSTQCDSSSLPVPVGLDLRLAAAGSVQIDVLAVDRWALGPALRAAYRLTTDTTALLLARPRLLAGRRSCSLTRLLNLCCHL
jgi:hypothetical protein